MKYFQERKVSLASIFREDIVDEILFQGRRFSLRLRHRTERGQFRRIPKAFEDSNELDQRRVHRRQI